MDCNRLTIFIVFLAVMLMSPVCAVAEERITGDARSADGEPAAGVIVRLYRNEKVKGFANTKADGSFSISVDELADSLWLRFLSKKFETLDYPLPDPSQPVKVSLVPKDFELKEVNVHAPSRRIKGDTIEYNVSAMTKDGDRSIEDVIRKIPGIEINDDGSIMYDGMSINHFYIEDLDLMGKNYVVASRSISPEDIYSVSVYERHQDKKVLQGKEESSKASLNLKLKKGRMLKPVGHVSGGAGHGENTLWNAELYGMLISPANQTVVSAKGNNVGDTYVRNIADSKYSVFTQTPFGAPKIDKTRYIDNHSMTFSANTLCRFSKDFHFKINADYDKDNFHFNGASVTEYLTPGQESLIYSENVKNSLDSRMVDVKAKLEGNRNKFFLNEDISFSGRFERNGYNVNNNAQETNQRLKTDSYRFSNTLETIFELGGRILRISSETYLQNSPGATMIAVNPDINQVTVSQRVGMQTFHNRESTALEWHFPGNLSAGTSVKFEIDRDRFHSYGIKIDDDGASNDLSGYRIDTAVEPFIKFRMLGAGMTLSLPLNFLNLRYNDLLNGKVHKNNTAILDARLDVLKRINRGNFMSVGLGTVGSLGDMQDFIVNPVYTTFRNSRSFGTGRLGKARTNFAVVAYSFKNVLEDIYLNSILNYNSTESDAIAVSDVSQSGSTSGAFLNEKNHRDNAIWQLTASKGVNQIHSVFTLKITDSWTKGKSIRSGVAVSTNSNALHISGKVETYQFSEILRLFVNVSYRCQNISYGGKVSSTSTNSAGIDGRISLFPIKNLELFYSADYSRIKYGDDNYKNNSFMDAGAIYNAGKIELGISARNICNQKEYAYTLYHSLDNAFYSYALRPFEVMFTLKWKF